MGMAASQARYLALTARKSNVEYEGQQINQARTALANQTANLFNQMLGMSVPTPPSTDDYTTVQYSYSDGSNTEVLSNYYQLGTADSDYNYVVTTYHNEKVYTGSRKKLNDPQVQATVTNNYSYSPTSTDENSTKIVSKAVQNTDGSYLIENTEGTTTIFSPVTAKQEDQVKSINAGNGVYSAKTTADTVAKNDITYDGTANTMKYNGTTYNLVVPGASSNTDAAIKTGYGVTTVAANEYFTDGKGNYITKTEYDAGAGAAKDVTISNIAGKGINATAPQDYYTDGKTFVTKADLDSAVTKYNNYVSTGKKETNSINYITPGDDPTYSNYTSVGNCKLTELTTSDLADKDTKAEIDQIIKDMKSSTNGDTTSAENLAKCFDADGNYTGGLYKFTMNGTTYYTTESDLKSSASTSIVDNQIDVQQDKLSYYNASYLDKKVEDTQKALLETDGTGRFTSIKMADDSVTYTLNSESTTNEDAYNDAMNKYYYDKQVYEKSISDINAKTETIQAQDRTLELRLEQLNTEQSALQNEMEAVKKVVDKHVELGFKTFGG